MPGRWRGSAGQVRRNFRQLSPRRTTGFFFTVVPPQDNWIFFSQLSPHRTTGFFSQDHWIFFTVVGLDNNLDIFFLGRIPTLARARQGFYAGQVARPGGTRSAKPQHVNPTIRLRCRAGGAARRLGAAGAKPPNPHSPPGPCYMYYMCYMALTRQAPFFFFRGRFPNGFYST